MEERLLRRGRARGNERNDDDTGDAVHGVSIVQARCEKSVLHRELREMSRSLDAEILRAKCRSTCSALSHTREVRDRVTWSNLPWRGPDAELDDVLVLL